MRPGREMRVVLTLGLSPGEVLVTARDFPGTTGPETGVAGGGEVRDARRVRICAALLGRGHNVSTKLCQNRRRTLDISRKCSLT